MARSLNKSSSELKTHEDRSRAFLDIVGSPRVTIAVTTIRHILVHFGLASDPIHVCLMRDMNLQVDRGSST